MMTIYSIAIFVLLFTILFAINIKEFRPTTYYLVSKFHLYKFRKNLTDINKLDIREIEYLIQFLILERCSDENRVVREVRNGYKLRYFPEGVDRNKRWVPSNYLEIEDGVCNVILRICFNDNSEPKYQIERRQDSRTLQSMFENSEQGKIKDFLQYAYTTDGRMKIVERYRDYVIRNIM